MTATPHPRACPSELRLLQLDAGELTEAARIAARTHVATCQRCTATLTEIADERARFAVTASAATPIWLARAPVARPPSRWLRHAAPVLALAAAALVLVLVTARDSSTGEPGERRKGGALALGFYVHRGDAVRAGMPGQIVFPADQLRFTMRGDRGVAHVAVLSLDGAGHASIYTPPLRLALSARPEVLPGAIELDEVLGPERVFGLACPRPFDPETVRAALERDRALTAPIGCVVDELALDKRSGSAP